MRCGSQASRTMQSALTCSAATSSMQQLREEEKAHECERNGRFGENRESR